MTTASLSSHVLDLQHGVPGRGLAVAVYSLTPYKELGAGITDDDGRIKQWPATLELVPGTYLVSFDTGTWYASQRQPTLYPKVDICFTVSAGQSHYHIPLLLSPFGYSTYRGS
ncbi:MAG: hydroxyisourate hydrolase [Pseudomonadota bacterium]